MCYVYYTRRLKRAALIEKPPQREQIMALDHDGQGVDQLEFVVGMLQVLGVELCGEPLSWGDVRPFMLLFDRLDVDNNKKLSKTDLETYAQMTELAKLGRAQAKARVQAKARALPRARAALARATGSLAHFKRPGTKPASGVAWVPQASGASERRTNIYGVNEGRLSACVAEESWASEESVDVELPVAS